MVIQLTFLNLDFWRRHGDVDSENGGGGGRGGGGGGGGGGDAGGAIRKLLFGNGTELVSRTGVNGEEQILRASAHLVATVIFMGI